MKKVFLLTIAVLLLFLTAALPVQNQMTYDNDLSLGWYWSAASGNVNHYNVYVKIDDGSYTLTGTTPTAPTAANPYRISGEAFRVYKLQVEAEDGLGMTGPRSEESYPAMDTPGDANYDGAVELTDFSLVSRYWQRSQGDPLYNPSADLNDDEIIDIEDMSLVTRYWGNVYYSGAPGQPTIIGDSLGQLDISVSPTLSFPRMITIKVSIESAKEVTAVGFKIELEPGLQIQEVRKNITSGQGELWSPDSAQKNNSAMILINFDQPQNGQVPLATISAVINEDYCTWHKDTTVRVKYGQLSGLKSKSSFCVATKTILLKPVKPGLGQNFPNPFNPETWIPYQLTEGADTTIKIYGLNGQLVRTLNLGYRQAGFYHGKTAAAYWDGKNEAGEKVASGVYFYTLTAGRYGETKKMVIH